MRVMKLACRASGRIFGGSVGIAGGAAATPPSRRRALATHARAGRVRTRSVETAHATGRRYYRAATIATAPPIGRYYRPAPSTGRTTGRASSAASRYGVLGPPSRSATRRLRIARLEASATRR